MDFLDRIALLLSPRRSSSKAAKAKKKSLVDEVSPKKVPSRQKKESFAEKHFSKPDKIYNDQFQKENPYRPHPDRGAGNLLETVLPFMKGRQDWAEWTYRNRYGVFTTVAIYLSVLMGFSLVNFEMSVNTNSDGVLIDVREFEELEQILEKMKQEAENPTTEAVNNQISDLNSTTKEDYSYEKYAKQDPMDSKKLLYESLDNLMESRQSMRNYIATMDKLEEQSEKEIRESRKMRDSLRKVAKEQESLHSNKKGNVTVSYDLKGRRALYLEMPAYLCEGGGKVVLNIEVNRMGKVVSASIKESYGVDDTYVLETAIWAAKESLFDTNTSAEARQKGTMTYIFIAQ